MTELVEILATSDFLRESPIWWHRWVTLATLVLMFLGMARNWVPPDVAFVGGVVIVVATGIVTPEQAFHGLSNHAVITVGAMFIVAAGMRETGALHLLVTRLLGSQTSIRSAVARITCPASAMSAFMNNTPIVAMLIPEVLAWCRKRSLSPSKVLIPLSFATILGGMCTLIGTSTLLVTDGIMQANGLEPLTLFEPAWIGLPIAFVGLGFILTVGIRLLPDRKELMAQLGDTQREYIIEMTVQPGCSLIGDSVQNAGLRQLPGLFLIEINRVQELISPVGPTEILAEGDRLVFTGIVETIVDLQRIPGLVPAAEKHYDLDPAARRQRRMCEAVVSASFPGLGKTIRRSDFRTRYDAVVVAVHRNGERLRKKIGDIILRPGDTLLIQAGEHFERTFRGSTDFYLVSEVRDSMPIRHDRAWMAIVVLYWLLVGMLVGTDYVYGGSGAYCRGFNAIVPLRTPGIGSGIRGLAGTGCNRRSPGIRRGCCQFRSGSGCGLGDSGIIPPCRRSFRRSCRLVFIDDHYVRTGND